jgi:hypothetical protein
LRRRGVAEQAVCNRHANGLFDGRVGSPAAKGDLEGVGSGAPEEARTRPWASGREASPHIARNFVARAVEVRKVRARRAELILEVWGRIVLKYIRVRTSRIDPVEFWGVPKHHQPQDSVVKLLAVEGFVQYAG